MPAINSNFTHHISGSLADGTSIAGQVNISHPSAPTALPDSVLAPVDDELRLVEAHDRIEDANLPGSLPVLRRQHIAVSKDDEEDLPAPIERVWYINPYGHEIWPVANSKVLAALQGARAVVFSIGSLYTSIVPSLILHGVGAALADGPSERRKILILNSKIDRETGPKTHPMTAVAFVRAIARACKESQADFSAVGPDDCGLYVTHLVHLEAHLGGGGDTGVPLVDCHELTRLGIQCVQVGGGGGGGGSVQRYDEAELAAALDGILES